MTLSSSAKAAAPSPLACYELSPCREVAMTSTDSAPSRPTPLLFPRPPQACEGRDLTSSNTTHLPRVRPTAALGGLLFVLFTMWYGASSQNNAAAYILFFALGSVFLISIPHT